MMNISETKYFQNIKDIKLNYTKNTERTGSKVSTIWNN